MKDDKNKNFIKKTRGLILIWVIALPLSLMLYSTFERTSITILAFAIVASVFVAILFPSKNIFSKQHKKTDILQEAKAQASAIIEGAERRGNQMLEEAKEKARAEGAQLIEHAKSEAAKEIQAARDELRKDLSSLIVEGTERLLEKNIDAASNQQLIDDLVKEL